MIEFSNPRQKSCFDVKNRKSHSDFCAILILITQIHLKFGINFFLRACIEIFLNLWNRKTYISLFLKLILLNFYLFFRFHFQEHFSFAFQLRASFAQN
jgi:hypothetical protein